nr:kelch domain-containing protein 10 homolog [Onthophagus taurus]
MGYHRILEFIYNLLLLILIPLIRMGSNDGKNRIKPIKNYTFKLFKYEKVQVNKKISRRIPLPRSGHRIVCDTKNLYSFGGYNPAVVRDNMEIEDRDDDELSIHSFPLFQELWKFNFATRRWTRFNCRESLPPELASNAVIRRGNYLMVYGGTGSPFGYRCSNQLYICKLTDINSRMTEINTKGPPPVPQYGQALVYYNDSLYTIGGTTGFSYTCDIHKLNMKTQSWESVYICQGKGDYEPEGRYRHEVGFDGQCIYILGGGTVEDVFDFAEIPVFDLEKLQWSVQKALPDSLVINSIHDGYPPPRRCHGAVQLEFEDEDFKVFITGGYSGDQIYDDLWCLNLRTFQWTLVTSCRLQYPTYFHSSAVTPEGKMYVFGGIISREDIERSNTIHSTWLCIPKLSEICWEALLHYNPKMISYSKSELINAGLPRHFAQRIE